jgi:hypothetical protein
MMTPARPGRGRNGEDRQGSEPESQRPAPPPPQGEAQHRPADHVDDEQRALQPVPGAAHAGGDAEHGRDEEQDTVDDPVASRPRRDRRVVVLQAEGLAEDSTCGGHTGSLGGAAPG